MGKLNSKDGGEYKGKWVEGVPQGEVTGSLIETEGSRQLSVVEGKG